MGLFKLAAKSQGGITSIELVTLMLVAVMCIWVIRWQTAYPVQVAYWEAAEAMGAYGGTTEGTVAPPAGPAGVVITSDP